MKNILPVLLDFAIVYGFNIPIQIVGVHKSKMENDVLKFWWNSSTSITGKVRFNLFPMHWFLKQGPARVESDEKIQWGTLNKQAKWEGGVIEFDLEQKGILYRRYEKGVKVKDSCRKFDGFKWSKP